MSNAVHTAVNACVWSSYVFVINTSSKCSTNWSNVCLTCSILYACFTGLYVPFSTSVPQKSNSTAFTIMLSGFVAFKKIS